MTSGLWRSLLAAALWTISAGVGAASWVVEGRVVGISDGDTITVFDRAKTQHKIRLSGIDAPDKGQVFGERSKQNLAGLLHGKRVEGRCPKRDRYGRRRPCAVRAPTLSRPPPGVLMLFSGAKTKMSIFIRQLLHLVL